MKKHMIALAAGAMLAAGSASAADQKFNLQTNPFGLVFGNYNVEVDYKVHDKMTVAPIFSMFNLDLVGTKFGMMGYGAKVNYHAKGAYKTGLYATGVFKYTSISMEVNDIFLGKATGDTSMTLFGASGGYQWHWDAFNMKLGAGYGMASIGDLTVTYSDNSTSTASGLPAVGFIADFNMGWKF